MIIFLVLMFQSLQSFQWIHGWNNGITSTIKSPMQTLYHSKTQHHDQSFQPLLINLRDRLQPLFHVHTKIPFNMLTDKSIII